MAYETFRADMLKCGFSEAQAKRVWDNMAIQKEWCKAEEDRLYAIYDSPRSLTEKAEA